MPIFYHVSRLGELPSTLDLSTDFSRFCEVRQEKYFHRSDLIELLFDYFPNGLSAQGRNYFADRFVFHDVDDKSFMQHTPFLELTCEMVRRLKFPHLPSRLECLFAFETIAEARDFKAEFGDMSSIIYQVEAEKHYRFDMNTLFLAFNIAGSLLFVERYWSGKESANPKWEILLPLPVKILQRVV